MTHNTSTPVKNFAFILFGRNLDHKKKYSQSKKNMADVLLCALNQKVSQHLHITSITLKHHGMQQTCFHIKKKHSALINCSSNNKPTLVYFLGAGSTCLNSMEDLAFFSNEMSFDVFTFDYPFAPQSTRSIRSHKDMVDCGIAMIRYILGHHRVPPRNILLFGDSYGAFVAQSTYICMEKKGIVLNGYIHSNSFQDFSEVADLCIKRLFCIAPAIKFIGQFYKQRIHKPWFDDTPHHTFDDGYQSQHHHLVLSRQSDDFLAEASLFQKISKARKNMVKSVKPSVLFRPLPKNLKAQFKQNNPSHPFIHQNALDSLSPKFLKTKSHATRKSTPLKLTSSRKTQHTYDQKKTYPLPLRSILLQDLQSLQAKFTHQELIFLPEYLPPPNKLKAYCPCKIKLISTQSAHRAPLKNFTLPPQDPYDTLQEKLLDFYKLGIYHASVRTLQKKFRSSPFQN